MRLRCRQNINRQDYTSLQITQSTSILSADNKTIQSIRSALFYDKDIMKEDVPVNITKTDRQTILLYRQKRKTILSTPLYPTKEGVL
jgi:hypothetical protein